MADIDIINVGGVDYNIKDATARNAIASQVVPVNHASPNTTYGHGTSANYGHVKLSDNYWDYTNNYENSGVAPSIGTIYNMYTDAVAHYSRVPETSSLDNKYRAGFYSYADASNKPSNEWGDVIVGGVANRTYNSFISQLALPYFTNKIATRFFDSSTGAWGGWNKYYSEEFFWLSATAGTGSGRLVLNSSVVKSHQYDDIRCMYGNGIAIVTIACNVNLPNAHADHIIISSGLPNPAFTGSDLWGCVNGQNSGAAYAINVFQATDSTVGLKLRTNGVTSSDEWIRGQIVYLTDKHAAM